jgi:hypothetical protein
MHSRITRVDNRRMPPVASSIPDQTFAYLLRLWIVDHLTARPGFEEWQTRMFGSPDVPEADPTADPDEDGVANRVEYLAGGDPLNPLDAWKPTIELVDEGIRLRFTRPAHARSLIEYTDDIFDPTAWRPLEVPENAHFIPARPRDTVIIRPGLQSARFYRVRLLDR